MSSILSPTAEKEQQDKDEALFVVCYFKGDLGKIQSLLESGANPNWRNHQDGNTALLASASNGCTHVVRYLLENTAADVNAVDNMLWTACHYAAEVGILEMMKVLVAHGANIHCKSLEGKTPLDIAKLRKIKPIVDYIQTVAGKMSLFPEQDVLQLPQRKQPYYEDCKLFEICCKSLISSEDKLTIQSLLKKGANPNWKSRFNGQTALMAATCNGLLFIVKYLVENKAADINAMDDRRRTGLMLAASNGHTKTVKYLAENTAVDVNAKDDDGQTAMLQAAKSGHINTVRYLLEKTTADVDVMDKIHWTACHYAVDYGFLDMVKLLVAHGANIHLESEGKTPLDLAKLRKRKSIVDYLETVGATQLYTRAVQRAMRDGVTRVYIVKVLIIGAPGSGKTSLRYLLLGLPPPRKRTSTPLASRAVRAISIHRVKADGSGCISTWKELDDDTYLGFIAEEVKVLELNPSRVTASSDPSTSTATEDSVPQQPPSPLADQEAGTSSEKCTSPVNNSQKSSSKESASDYISPLPSMGSTMHTLVASMVSSPPTIPKNLEQKKTFVHLIDSGGQPSFVSLVPAFVRGSTVNIVVSKYNRDINDKLHYEYVKDDQHLRQPTELEQSQLESIEELVRTLSSVKHSKEGSAQGSSEPKFLLVGTHADKHWSLFDESLGGKNRWLKKSLGELKSMCIEISPDGNILLPINTQVTKGRSNVASSLRQKIMKACSNAGVDIPTKWYVFELEVNGKAKKEGRSVLSRAECLVIGENLRMRKEDVTAALVFLDDAALCMYFKDATPHLLFTDPQTILSEVTEILNLGIIDVNLISSLYPLLSEHMALVRRLRSQGLFSRKLVDVLCSDYRVNVDGKCIYTVDDFLAILKHLLIVASVSIDKEELFFIPSILSSSKKTVPGLDGELPPLVLLCRTKVMPLGLFTALVVALLCDVLFSLYEIVGRDVVCFRCTSGGLVMLVECHACLVVHFNGDPSVAPQVRAAIHCAIAKVCQQRHLDTSKIAFTDGFWCPYKKCESIPHPCEVNVFTGWLTCSVRPAHGSGRCTDERMLAWLEAPDASYSVDSSSTAKSANPTSPSTSDSHEISLFQFTESVAAVIPDKWRRVGLVLGLTQAQLNAIDDQHRGKSLESFAEVFSMWQQLATPDNNPVKWSTLVSVLKSRTVAEETLAESIQSNFLNKESNYTCT